MTQGTSWEGGRGGGIARSSVESSYKRPQKWAPAPRPPPPSSARNELTSLKTASTRAPSKPSSKKSENFLVPWVGPVAESSHKTKWLSVRSCRVARRHVPDAGRRAGSGLALSKSVQAPYRLPLLRGLCMGVPRGETEFCFNIKVDSSTLIHPLL